MADLNTSISLSLRDRFSSGIRGAGSAVSSFSNTAVSGLNKLDRAFSGVGTAVAALGATLSVGAATKEIIDLDDKLIGIGTQANISAERVNELKSQIFDVATAPDIKLNASDLTASLDSVIQMTGDMDFAQSNLKSMAQAIRATGASGEAIGGLYAEFQKLGFSADDASSAIDTLNLQGKAGAFTLENLASLGPRTISAYTATGRSGTDALREMGAALQVIRMGTGSSEQAATAFEAVMRNLTSPDKQEKLHALGVAVRDQEGNFRSVTNIMEDIVKGADGSTEVLGQIFDAEAMRAFNFAIGEFQRTGAVGSLEKFNKILGDGSSIQADAARRASSLKANITGLQTAFVKFADSKLTEPLSALTEQLNKLAENPEAFERIFKGIAVGLGAIVAVKGLATVVNLISGLKGLRGGQARIGAGAAGGAGMPVFVTNMGGAGLGAGSSASTSLGNSLGSRTVTNKMLAGGAIAGGALAAAVAIPSMINELSAIEADTTLTNEEKGTQKGGAIGGAAGTIAGTAFGGAAGVAGGAVAAAATGALVGSVIPGLGTIIGGLIGVGIGVLGTLAGGAVGRAVGEKIGGAVAKEDAPESIQETSSPANEYTGQTINQSLHTDVTLTDKRTTITQESGNTHVASSFPTGDARQARSSR